MKRLLLTGGQIGPDGLKVISSMACLEFLDLSLCTCKADDAALSGLGLLKRLRHLDLSGLPAGRQTFKALRKCRFLSWLAVARARLEGEDLKFLLASVPLEYL